MSDSAAGGQGPAGGTSLRDLLPAVAAGLPAYLPTRRWFARKGQRIVDVAIRDLAAMPDHPTTGLAIADVRTDDGIVEGYFLPLSLVDVPLSGSTGPGIVRLDGRAIRDGIDEADACRALLRGILGGGSLPTDRGGSFEFRALRPVAGSRPAFGDLNGGAVAVRHVGVEQSNSSVIFGERLILKALRRLAGGVNPEIEVLRFLAEATNFDRAPALVGWAEYRPAKGDPAPVGVLQRFVPNDGDGWSFVLRAADAAATDGRAARALVARIGELGRTLADLHLALLTPTGDPAFAAEPIGAGDVAAWRERTRASLEGVLARLAADPPGGPDDGTGRASAIVAGRGRLQSAVDGIAVLGDGAVVKARHHGDFHLGQALATADGWSIIDFEGEPLRPLAERRSKQTPLRDLAGLLRSLDYARATAARRPQADPAALAALFADARSAAIAGYAETVAAAGAPLLPAGAGDRARVLRALELEKAVYELRYELGNRPDWVAIPLEALARLAGDDALA